MKRIKVSNNVIRRLPRYLRKLDELNEQGVSRISSGELGKQLGLTPSQIRQDFSCFGDFGQQGYGYNVMTLRQDIASILGMDRGFNAILLGAGNIGNALLNNFSFSNCGVSLEAAFDSNPEKIGKIINGVPVLSDEVLIDYVKEHNPDIAVLCVPKEVAKKLTNELVELGVKAFWNFTNIELTDPNSPILVENMHFSDSLLSLSYYVSDKEDEEIARQNRQNRLNNRH